MIQGSADKRPLRGGRNYYFGASDLSGPCASANKVYRVTGHPEPMSSVLRKPFEEEKNKHTGRSWQKKMNQILSNRRLVTRISIEALEIIVNSLSIPGSVKPLRDTTDPTDYKLPSHQQEITNLSG